MEKRPIISSHRNELLDPESFSFHNPFHHNPWILGNTADFSNRNNQLSLQPLLCNTTDHFMSHSDYNFYHSNQFKAMQNHQPIANSRVGGYIAPPNFSSNPYMASSSSNPPLPFHEVMGAGLDGHGWRNHDFDNSRRWNKRKNAEIIPEVFYHGSGASTSSSSLSSDPCPWTRSFESRTNVLNATQFMQPVHQHGFLPVQNGYQQNVDTISLPCEPSVLHHQNYLLEVHGNNYMGQIFQPARGNVWLDQYTHATIGDVGSSNWNYTHTTPALLGRSLNRGPIEIRNHGNSSYQDPTSSRDPSGSSHSLVFHNPNLHPAQDTHGHHHNHHEVPVPPCDRHVNNHTDSGFINPSRDIHALERINELHRRRSQASSGLNVLTDIVSPEDVALLQFSDYSIDNLIDRHRDMRMDIDNMTYEELVALQEKMGYVRTGLSEESVLKHLKTKLYMHPFPSLSVKSPHHAPPEAENCTICQVVFEKYDKIGILDCGHYYHPNCIKDWLLVKNSCPICKTTALLPTEKA